MVFEALCSAGTFTVWQSIRTHPGKLFLIYSQCLVLSRQNRNILRD